jgi:glyoxylase-like metal-dependent hydrolase (beta-lactamase superfamily II)
MHYRITPVTAFSQNCTLFICEESNKAAIIDPGGDVSQVIELIDELGLKVEKILLTHGHLDHVGGVAELIERYQVPIEGPHIADKFWIDALDQQCQMFGFSPVNGFSVDRWLEHDDTVTFGEQVLQVLHCPGHTPGHVVFYHEPSKLVQVGDVLFNGSIGRTDFPQGNHQHLLDSITQRLLPLGDDVEFIPGHGPMSTLGHERKTNSHIN